MKFQMICNLLNCYVFEEENYIKRCKVCYVLERLLLMFSIIQYIYYIVI